MSSDSLVYPSELHVSNLLRFIFDFIRYELVLSHGILIQSFSFSRFIIHFLLDFEALKDFKKSSEISYYNHLCLSFYLFFPEFGGFSLVFSWVTLKLLQVEFPKIVPPLFVLSTLELLPKPYIIRNFGEFLDELVSDLSNLTQKWNLWMKIFVYRGAQTLFSNPPIPQDFGV